MPLKIFHTADVHLGLTHGKHPADIAERLVEARFGTVERMVAAASKERCDLFVVGGDFFDTTRVPNKTVIRAAKILSTFEGTVLVLPGNHDYITHEAGDIWDVFQKAKGDRVIVLGKPDPVSLQPFGISATVYPAPCGSRHSKTSVAGWIADERRSAEAVQAALSSAVTHFHIGLAHGSFEGLTPDTEGDYFPMKRDELLACNLDLWLMGHIHLQFPKKSGSEKIYYPGTPEPDGFDCRHGGTAWIIELADDKQISAHSVKTGEYRFSHEVFQIKELSDIEKLKAQYSDGEFKNMLLKLKFTGDLPKGDHALLAEMVSGLGSRFLSLLPDYTALEVRLTADEIRREFPEESFAGRLLGELQKTFDDHDAFKLAYELIRQVKDQAVSE